METIYVIGYIEDGEFRWTSYSGEKTIKEVAIDMEASDINSKAEVYSHWFVAKSKEALELKVGGWVHGIQHYIDLKQL